MVVNNIKVFARLKNEFRPRERWCDILKSPKGEYEDLIFRKLERGENFNSYKFRFNKIFDETRNQEAIFDVIAKPVVSSVLQGFNGTIFAYGQTGSGKTYTMTGSAKKYEERGIIPRSLQHIFSTIEKVEEKPALYISYMEIYNEICYDLLNPRNCRTATRLEELPRVVILEDGKGEARLRNLSVLPVCTEEEAMRFLFLGDTNRAIAETPLNEYSSRSHCIFTVYITSKGQNMIYSKLNLVDLAGSERVHKSKITGNTLNEAKHINLSLHFLQQVILALSESKRTHIPYRNSLMTFILKDSVAGNCLTAMLATLDLSRKNIQETISTCKFAQRVSLIKTDPVINEVSDPYQEILLLKNEVQELRKQLANQKSVSLLQETSPLSNKQKEDLEELINFYLKSNDSLLKDDMDKRSYQYCYFVLKNKIKNLENRLEKPGILLTPQISVENQPGFEEKHFRNPHGTDFNGDLKANSEIEYYSKHLTRTYEKAQLLASVIEECQININYLREKQNVLSRAGDCQKKFLLSKEVEYQQRIYRNSLSELKELKIETLQLEAGLSKAKARILRPFENLKAGKSSFPETFQLRQDLREDSCSLLNRNGTRKFPDYFEKFRDNESSKKLHLPPLPSSSITDNYYTTDERSCCRFQNFNETYDDDDDDDCHCCARNSKNRLQVIENDVNPNCRLIHCSNGRWHKSKSNILEADSLEHENMKFLPNIAQTANRNPYFANYFSEKTLRDSRRVNVEPAGCKYKEILGSGNLCTNYCSFTNDYYCFHQYGTNCPKCTIVDTNKDEECINKSETTFKIKNLNEHESKEVSNENNQEIIPIKLSKSHSETLDGLEVRSPKGQEEPDGTTEEDTRNLKGNCKINEELVDDVQCEIFVDTDTEEFRKFMGTIELTGDEDVDKEICNFYRSKMCF